MWWGQAERWRERSARQCITEERALRRKLSEGEEILEQSVKAKETAAWLEC